MQKGNGRRGFATMSEERQREIAAMGGRAVPGEKRSFSKSRELAVAAGRKGGICVPQEKRSFSKDHALASRAGQIGGKGNAGRGRLPAKEARGHATDE